MRKTKYPVRLSKKDFEKAKTIAASGKKGSRIVRRAYILLMLDENRNANIVRSHVAQCLHASDQTVWRVAKTYNDEGLERTLKPVFNATMYATTKLTEEVRAQIVAIARSVPPRGSNGWSLRMLREKVIEMSIVDSISREGIRKVLLQAFCSSIK